MAWRKVFWASIAFGSALVTQQSVVFSGPLEDGLAAYKQGDYRTALSKWRPLAEEGKAYAEYVLGAMY